MEEEYTMTPSMNIRHSIPLRYYLMYMYRDDYL